MCREKEALLTLHEHNGASSFCEGTCFGGNPSKPQQEVLVHLLTKDL